MSGTLADTELIFSAALEANATSIILSHNHPSGGAKASKAGKQITERIEMGTAIRYYSYRPYYSNQ